MKVKIELNTVSEIANFVLAVSTVKEDVYLTNEKGLKVDGKSFLGVAHASEFANLWCECSADIYHKIRQFAE